MDRRQPRRHFLEERVVVQDRTDAGRLADTGARGVGQHHRERLVAFGVRVTQHLDGQGLRDLIGSERERAGLADEIAPRNRRLGDRLEADGPDCQ